jgi:O-antigen/teichoic acid export membrane protein
MIKIVSGLVAAKVLALFIGPGGIALIGNLRNVLNAVDTFSTLGVQNGVIKYVAENEKNEQKLYRILNTVIISIFCFTLLLSLILFFLAGFFSDHVFGANYNYGWVFKVLAFTLPWHAGNLIFMAVINGLGKFKQLISINIAGNVVGLFISTLLIWKLQVPGALLGLIISPALLFLLSFYMLQKHFAGFLFLNRKNFDFKIIRRLFAYSLMSMVTAILGSVIFILIRKMIIGREGLDAAGFWDAMNRISFFYLMFIATLLTVYFLPKLSIAKNNEETRSVFKSYYMGIVPLFVAACIVIYFLRHFIVRFLFTAEFEPMEQLFLWQLLGDVFKVASLILGYQFIAKKMTTAFIVTEIISFCILYLSSVYFIKLYGAEGAVMAHAFTYILYFTMLTIYFRKILVKIN